MVPSWSAAAALEGEAPARVLGTGSGSAAVVGFCSTFRAYVDSDIAPVFNLVLLLEACIPV